MSDNKLESSTQMMMEMLSFYTKAFSNPMLTAAQMQALGTGYFNMMTGKSPIMPPKGDKRWRDPVWATNPFYGMMMQSYLLWCQELEKWLSGLGLDERSEMRAKLALSLLTDTVSPTNTLAGNPTAMKVTLDHGGKNLVQGFKNFMSDMKDNNGLPSTVDKSKFEVGKNLATSEGQVIYREEQLELIEYAPKTEEIFETPIFIVPPQINKFYVWDLAKGRSIVEYLTERGHRVFIVSWRNPSSDQSDWGLNSYIEALDRATEVACEISKSDKLNMIGACSGGLTAAALQAYWGARKIDRANTFTLLVAILDIEGGKNTSMGLFANIETLEIAKMFSKSKGVLEGKDLERAFAWLRPNDLIWAYWVNNYLCGNSAPTFDILFWNADTTNLPATFHRDLIDLLSNGGFGDGPNWDVNGTTIDLKNVTCDTYIVGGETDHITPWDGCYLTTGLLGGNTEFVLSQAGHIQSLINPPGNPRAKFMTNSGKHSTTEEFLEGAEQHSGSWWPHWMNWTEQRSGKKIKAPKKLGSAKHKPLCPSPGTYVSKKPEKAT
ncbi:alpha/beta fold hydrolase [Paramylibacter kogurei]|nr:alpha/beta fold hydrolase [Amylibacter kogurei]